MIQNYNAVKISYKPISLSFERITLLSKNEYIKNKELIPIVKGSWWLRSPGNYDGTAAYVDCGFANIDDDGFCVFYTLGVRPALKIEYYNQLKPREKVRINGLVFTVLNDGILLCDIVVSKVMFDKISNNYDTSYIKTWLEDWAQENNITFEKE